jgi:hypothetical protein
LVPFNWTVEMSGYKAQLMAVALSLQLACRHQTLGRVLKAIWFNGDGIFPW